MSKYVDAHVVALASTWYINLRAAVGWEQTVVGGGQRGIVVAENGFAFRDGGNVADRPDLVTV